MNKNQNKKKNTILAVMLVVLMALIIMSGTTFSKYITSENVDTQSATVAKWGYVINVNTENLFGEKYGTPTNNVVTPNANGLSVVSGDLVVAPGTSGFLTFSVTGTAEVPAQISIAFANGLTTVCLKNGENVVYSPIVWTLTKDGETPVSGTLAEVVATLSADTIAAGQSANASYTLKWEWPLETSADNNDYDTMLAKFKNDPTNNPLPDGYTAELTLSFGMTIDVAQIQVADQN